MVYEALNPKKTHKRAYNRDLDLKAFLKVSKLFSAGTMVNKLTLWHKDNLTTSKVKNLIREI
jgi:hypothetical protein